MLTVCLNSTSNLYWSDSLYVVCPNGKHPLVAYLAGDLGTSLRQAFLRMDERMCSQSGDRELAIFRGKIEQASNVMEVSPGSPKSNEHNGHADDGSSEKAYNLTRDHKANLAAEKDRILKAGGFVRYGQVNWTLNLSRSIGDMELKRNKSLPADEQIVTANPDLNTVELCNDYEFLVIACDGICSRNCLTAAVLQAAVSELDSDSEDDEEGGVAS
ncbi:hypothetical protein C3L33_14521, partial [Rhododendron williamsianum]